MVDGNEDLTEEEPTQALGSPVDRVRQAVTTGAAAGSLVDGTLFEHFRVERCLGVGGMGEVYLARDTRLDRPVALKVIRRPLPSEEVTQRFLFEARATARFSHPHIVTIFSVGEHAGRPYLVLEYLEGRTLSGRIRQGALDAAELLRLGLAIAEALREAHGRGILHLDLKPANVFLPHDRPLRVLDFGLARTLGTSPSAPRAGDQAAAAKLGGTPAYMAPEQWRGGDLDGAADMWALGVILYELCSGARPFVGDSLPELAVAVCAPDPAPPLPARDDLPGALAPLVASCLHKLPAKRPTAERVAQVLRDLMAERDTATRRQGVQVPTLAVMPFEVRGEGAADLGEGVTIELIDLLSRMRGWRVLAAAATASYRRDWEPRAVAEDLDVQAIVHGTVERRGERVRTTIRLLDARSASQVWSERFEGEVVDLFELQDRLALRIAEALRSELTTTIHRGDASAEAVGSYLLARRMLRQDRLFGPAGAIDLLDECLELAPSFKPTLSARAQALMRAWFYLGHPDDRDWQALARRAVEQARRHAGELPETHLASARLHLVDGAFSAAVRDISRTLDIAPTCAEAHAFLAMLQCEAGLSDEGVRRARLAVELDPSLFVCHLDIMRDHALAGDWSRCERVIAELHASAPPDHPGVAAMELRIAAWRGDHATIRRRLDRLAETPSLAHQLTCLPWRAVLGELGIDEALTTFETLAGALHPRMRVLSGQLFAEAAFLSGAFDTGVELFLTVAYGPLVDIDWVDRCPALAPMRDHERYPEARAMVVERAAAIWSAGCPRLELIG